MRVPPWEPHLLGRLRTHPENMRQDWTSLPPRNTLNHSEPQGLKQLPAFGGPGAHTDPNTQCCGLGACHHANSQEGCKSHGTHWGLDCGRIDIELEEAEDPSAYLTCLYQPESLAVCPQWKDVCDRLEH